MGTSVTALPSFEIECADVPGRLVIEYAAIPIAFPVRSRLSAKQDSDGWFVLAEHVIAPAYIKDYDAIGVRPDAWATRFDTSQWLMLVARVDQVVVGGATVAFGGSGLDLLDGRGDLALLWDIRVAPSFRGRGIGRALFAEVEARTLAHGCAELKVETQNINVPACRFYAALGCSLRTVRAEAYPMCPGEDQYFWYKAL